MIENNASAIYNINVLSELCGISVRSSVSNFICDCHNDISALTNIMPYNSLLTMCSCHNLYFLIVTEHSTYIIQSPLKSDSDSLLNAVKAFKLYNVLKTGILRKADIELMQFENSISEHIKNQSIKFLLAEIKDIADTFQRQPDLSLLKLKSRLCEYSLSFFSTFCQLMHSSFSAQKLIEIIDKIFLADSNDDVISAFYELNSVINYSYKTCSKLHIVNRAIDYIRSTIPNNTTLNDAAKYVYVSPAYLCRVFKEITGENFSAYTNRLRIEEAKKLLAEGGHTLTEAATKVGFHNLNYFTKVFTKLVSVSPSEYKKVSERIHRKNVDLQ